MEIVYIQALLMDNGEILSLGKTLGYKKDMKVFEEVSHNSEHVIIKELKK